MNRFLQNFLLFLFSIPCLLLADEPMVHTVLQSKLASQAQAETQPKKKLKKPSAHESIHFYFDGESLVDIINFLASKREVNVVLPMGPAAIKDDIKVTLHLQDKITIEEAWDILYTLLEMSGYSMIAKENTYNIVKTGPGKEINREPLPLYIVKPDEIPNTDKRIRYLYYFSNIKVTQAQDDEILNLVKTILSPSGAPETAIARLDSQSNSLFLSDKASNIKSLMQIIDALDHLQSQEKPEVIQLRYLSADVVANLFNEQLLKSAADATQLRLGFRLPNNATYFKKVRIVPDMRTNQLVVFGNPQAIERVREFIHKYIDVQLEEGKSILHTYQLQYLDAGNFATVLRRIVASERIGGTEQSRTAAGQGGPDRFFSEVIIVPDTPKTISGEQPGPITRGSNNLIIAARNDDYERIKKVIEQLDTPQPQVIIEVLIADLTTQDLVSLGTSIRNPLGLGLPNNVNFQTAHATSTILTNTVVNPSTLQADLLRRAFNSAGAVSGPPCDAPQAGDPCFSNAFFMSQPANTGGNLGATIFSFNDAATGESWGLAQVQKLIDTKKVLHQPHLITTNNQEAEILLQEQRLSRDQGSGSTGGTTTQTRKWIPATLSVKITPRISSADIVNLQVVVNIEQFTTPASSFSNIGVDSANTANRIRRNVTTNANVATGNILALGGLTRIDTALEDLETPLLAKIPIIGWLFKDRTTTTNKNNLTVFISPMIVMPRIRGGVGLYTKNHVQLSASYSQEAMLFDNLRDPITRWFFKVGTDEAGRVLRDFIAQDEFVAPTIFDTRRNNKKNHANKDNAQPSTKEERGNLPIIATPEIAKADLKDIVKNMPNPFTQAATT